MIISSTWIPSEFFQAIIGLRPLHLTFYIRQLLGKSYVPIYSWCIWSVISSLPRKQASNMNGEVKHVYTGNASSQLRQFTTPRSLDRLFERNIQEASEKRLRSWSSPTWNGTLLKKTLLLLELKYKQGIHVTTFLLPVRLQKKSS